MHQKQQYSYQVLFMLNKFDGFCRLFYISYEGQSHHHFEIYSIKLKLMLHKK